VRLDWDTFLSFTRHNFNGNADVALIPTIERHRQPVLVWSAGPQLPALVTDSAGKEATPSEICCSYMTNLLDVSEAFRHFDIRAPGIFHERDCNAELRHLRVGTIQFDALRFELLRECLEVLDLEADMIDRPAGRADGRRRRRREVQGHSG
jgi:hypothetical protein